MDKLIRVLSNTENKNTTSSSAHEEQKVEVEQKGALLCFVVAMAAALKRRKKVLDKTERKEKRVDIGEIASWKRNQISLKNIFVFY